MILSIENKMPTQLEYPNFIINFASQKDKKLNFKLKKL